ncbi:hypothetical protein [Amycolatopsis jejuensis]|uniref:hypothetical protein n=1 Tax=Amycolatopsis jejuensis TaxID=330084 RepID=UPI0012E04B99|nr:hypothetical protein [Amycolatopsis jejuensis]
MRQLTQRSWVAIQSTDDLARQVRRQAAKRDEQLKKEERALPLRKSSLDPVSRNEHSNGFDITPWELLQTFGRATALSGQNPSRGLSQHWNCLRYLTTLLAAGNRMTRSYDGKNAKYHRLSVQAQDLGIAFAVAAAQRILRKRHPGYRFEAVDIDLALDAGWTLRGQNTAVKGTARQRPGYFLVGRRAGQPLLLVVVDGRGSHGRAALQYDQLVKSAERVHAIALGATDTPAPSLLMSAAFASEGGIEIRLLDPPGESELAIPGQPLPVLHGPVTEENFYPDIATQSQTGEHRSRPGFHLKPDRYEWFSRVLVRSAAAALLTFVGDRDHADQYLTRRQQLRLGRDRSQHALNAECDVRVTLGGVNLVGTDHIFRFESKRVEVFSAMPARLHTILAAQDTKGYEDQLPAVRTAWAQRVERIQEDWNGIITMDDDGAVMGLRWLGDGIPLV